MVLNDGGLLRDTPEVEVMPVLMYKYSATGTPGVLGRG